MELVEGEKSANRLWFFILGDSSSSSSSPSVNQRSKWRLLVCLKQQASTKIHFRTKIFREKTSHSEAEQKEQRKHQGPSSSLITQGLYRHQALYARLLCKVAAKGKHAAAEHVLAPGKCHAETRDRAGDLQSFSLTLSQLSYRGSVQNCRCC